MGLSSDFDLQSAPLRPIEAIMNYGSKESTYKLALIRAINDWVIEHATKETDHRIPMSWIALKFLEYYWPLLASDPVIQLSPKGGRRLEVGRFIDAYIGGLKQGKGLLGLPAAERHPSAPDHWALLSEVLLHDRVKAPEAQRLILKVRRIILDQPVRYIRNVGGSKVQFFSLETGEERDFERARQEGMSPSVVGRLRAASSVSDLIEQDPTSFVIPVETFQAIRPLRYCILGSLTAKWFGETERFYQATGRSVPGDLMSRIIGPTSARDQMMMQRYREIYLDHGLAATCTLTGRRLKSQWDLDHVVPWSRFPVDTFWNLVPLSKTANRRKSNVLFRVEGAYRDRLEGHYERCLEVVHPFFAADLGRISSENQTWSPQSLIRHVGGLICELSTITGLPIVEASTLHT